jgi:HEPN domain-containing protein
MSDPTREAVEQWLARARSDWATVEILLASKHAPAETVCFHSQQYAEKLLKALLTQERIEAPRTHDLRRLIQLGEPSAPDLASLADAADALTVHGVQSRYSGDWYSVEPAEMNRAVTVAKEFEAVIMPRLKTDRAMEED